MATLNNTLHNKYEKYWGSSSLTNKQKHDKSKLNTVSQLVPSFMNNS